MKKLLALVLILLTALPLVACSGSNDQSYNSAAAKEYVGNWILFGEEGYVLEIAKDGTAKTISPEETNDLTWYYNSQMNGIFLAGNGMNAYFIQIETEAGCRYILMDGKALYHQDDADLANAAEAKRKHKLVDKRFENFTKANWNETITMANGVTIQIKDVKRENGKLVLQVAMSNSREKAITLAALDFYTGIVYNRTSLSSNHTSLSTNSAIVEPGKTNELTLTTDFAKDNIDIQYALIGFNFESGKYCFDISDFVK